MIFTDARTSWSDAPADAPATIARLEAGGVLRYPGLAFAVSAAERALFTPKVLASGRKNVSYDLSTNKLAAAADEPALHGLLQDLLKRYAEQSRTLAFALLPHYLSTLAQGRTSFRPAEIAGRASSIKKDDTRLHIDAFPATPLQGRRILRVFTNVNPGGKTRHWRVGESFTQVAQRFAAPRQSAPAALRKLLQALKVTKSYRTAYDDLMLQTHDAMKLDNAYQASVPRQDVHFAAGESWVLFSDQVSHAALGGQHLLEQTFYLPAHAMADPEQSPLRILERLKGRPLLN